MTTIPWDSLYAHTPCTLNERCYFLCVIDIRYQCRELLESRQTLCLNMVLLPQDLTPTELTESFPPTWHRCKCHREG